MKVGKHKNHKTTLRFNVIFMKIFYDWSIIFVYFKGENLYLIIRPRYNLRKKHAVERIINYNI